MKFLNTLLPVLLLLLVCTSEAEARRGAPAPTVIHTVAPKTVVIHTVTPKTVVVHTGPNVRYINGLPNPNYRVVVVHRSWSNHWYVTLGWFVIFFGCVFVAFCGKRY